MLPRSTTTRTMLLAVVVMAIAWALWPGPSDAARSKRGAATAPSERSVLHVQPTEDEAPAPAPHEST